VGNAPGSTVTRAMSSIAMRHAPLDPPVAPGALRRMGIACGHFLFRYRDILFPITVILLVLTTSPGLPFGSHRLDHCLDVVGLGVAALGQMSRLLAVGSVESIRRRGDHRRIAAHRLIREGIFAHTRNPLYLGNWLIVLGLVLIANNHWWYLLVLPGFTIAYGTIVLAEEDFLTATFGQEFAGYAATVNRFIPDRRGLFRVLVSKELDWRRAFGKELRVACNWLSAALLLIIWERWTHHGIPWRLMAGLPALILLGRIPIPDRIPGSAAARNHPPDPPEPPRPSPA
jgi:protein-S-isoprenylcysteine O-methyltransferase Ste14